MSWWSEYVPHIPEPAFWDFIGHEQHASSVMAYECQLIPALLQTEAYARSVLSEFYTEPERIEALVHFRMERQQRSTLAQQKYIIDEAVFRNVMGTAEVMGPQLQRLLDDSGRDGVTLHVVPGTTSNPNFRGPHWLFENGDGADVLYLERTPSGSIFTGSAAEIAEHKTRFIEFSDKALDAERSLTAIRRALDELG